MDDLKLVPLCSATIPVSGVHTLEGTPAGSLMVGELRDARFEGERFAASQCGAAAADWLTVTPSGVACPDVRMTLETDDGETMIGSFFLLEAPSRKSAEALFASDPMKQAGVWSSFNLHAVTLRQNALQRSDQVD